MEAPIQVLLVEPDPGHALLARTCLTAGDLPGEPPMEVTIARDLAEALTRLREREHRAVVLELALPDALQLDALRAVVRAAPSVPVVVLTSHEDDVMAAAATGFGAHDYLIKQQLAYLSLPRVVRHAVARNRLSRRLADSQGAVSLSALGASLTHEINNALAYVSSNLDFLAENLAELARRAGSLEAPSDHADEVPEPSTGSPDWFKMLEAALSDARHGASRIETVVATLRDFSLQDSWDGAPVDLKDVLEKALRLAMNEITHRCRLVRDYQASPRVQMDPRALGQVLLTLFAYVAQSLPEDRGERNRVVVRVEEGEGTAIVVLEDNGPGMPQQVVEQLFDPVHAMKPQGLPGKLGLFVAHRILSEMGGTIAVQSEEAWGTSFRITLQSAVGVEAAAGRERQGRAEPSDADLVTRRGRVLVIDDEQAIGAAICRLLESDHDVTLPADASEALELLEREDLYDVVFCDLMMPGMSGMDIYEKMASRPEVRERLVFMTAGTFSERADAFLRSEHIRCIQKPFDRETLRTAVSEGIRHRNVDRELDARSDSGADPETPGGSRSARRGARDQEPPAGSPGASEPVGAPVGKGELPLSSGPGGSKRVRGRSGRARGRSGRARGR